MEIIFLLLALSICLALFFLISFLWATRSGQFDDTYGPAHRVLFEDGEIEPEDVTKKDK